MLLLASSTSSSPSGGREVDALVVVVHRHRQDLLGLLLPDDVGVQRLVDLLGRGQVLEERLDFSFLGELVFDDVVAQFDALIADVDARTRDQLLDVPLALAAERTLQRLGAVRGLVHSDFASPLRV